MIRKCKNEVSTLNLTSLWWNHIVLKLTNYKCTNWTLFTRQTKSLYRISVLEPWKTGVWSLTEKHPSSTILKCPPVPTDIGWLLSSHMSSHTWYVVWCCVVLWHFLSQVEAITNDLYSFTVVWKPRDYEMVEQPVAQWRICHICFISWSWLCRAYLEYCKTCKASVNTTQLWCNTRGRGLAVLTSKSCSPAERSDGAAWASGGFWSGRSGFLPPAVITRGRYHHTWSYQWTVWHNHL